MGCLRSILIMKIKIDILSSLHKESILIFEQNAQKHRHGYLNVSTTVNDHSMNIQFLPLETYIRIL